MLLWQQSPGGLLVPYMPPPAFDPDEDAPKCFDCGAALPAHAMLFQGGSEWFPHDWCCGHGKTLTCAACMDGKHHQHCPECGLGDSYT